MKKIIIALVLLMCGIDGFAAPGAGGASRTSSSRTSASRAPVATPTNNAAPAVSGTAVVTTRGSARSATPAPQVVRGRAATQPVASTPDVSTRGRSAVTVPSANAARAAKQSVISTGTKVATAAQNTVVDDACWTKFNGCMDSFCMLDNANGGRCICSDKNSEYDAILAEIQELDNQSYQMATVGVERIEMGNDADAVMAQTNAITNSILKDAENAKSKRKSLDLTAWASVPVDFDNEIEEMFDLSSDGVSIQNKTGDALYRASAKLCGAQLPECASQLTMMDLMYKQRVRSDCTAYENSLRAQRTQSAQKLAAAQGAMREAALEQYRAANKYDLGQCTVQFKQCMQTTGGCGDDFTGCVTWETTRERMSETGTDADGKPRQGAVKTKKIQGASTSIEIAAWTYDVLESKKPLCMTVTQQCVNVRDQVWDTFLREVAPQVKSAELIAESNLRMSCIADISNCFQKACRDTMDPNDPEGSYDMCLTRPETLESVCKIQIDPCKATEPKIMDYVRARLASMRVDSCTNAFKACLQSEDRCGSDYTQCVGLDTETIVSLCPAEKLVGCTYEDNETAMSGVGKKRVRTAEEIYAELANIAQGIFLNIDNNVLAACQKTVQTKIIGVCGDVSSCDAFDDDEIIGTESLNRYIDNNGNTVIDGLMNFGLIKDTGSTDTYTLEYSGIVDGTTDKTAKQILGNVNAIQNKINQKIALVANDYAVIRCVKGRDNSWRYSGDTTVARSAQPQTPKPGQEQKGESQNGGRGFENLLASYKSLVFNAAIERAERNYRIKYDAEVAAALKAQSDVEKRLICNAMAYSPDSLECDNTGTNCGVDGGLGNLLEGLYSDNKGTSGISADGYSYTVKNADLAKKLELFTKNKGTIVVKNDDGAVISVVERSALYSDSTGICTITTQTTQCLGTDKYATESDFYKEKRHENGELKKQVCDDCKFETMCTEYADPQKRETEIQL